MKIFFNVLLLIILLFLVAAIFYYRDFTVANNLTLKRSWEGSYYFYYENIKIADEVSGLDSWYVYQNYVHGSTTDSKGRVLYFIVNVCNGKVYESYSYQNFYKQLDLYKIPVDQRNYMSGDNIVKIRLGKNKYIYQDNCKTD